MIQGLRELLESIQPWPEITTIIPGRIKPTKGAGVSLHLTVQMPTTSGLKCLARRSGQIQEVFIVTRQPSELEKRLRSLSARSAK